MTPERLAKISENEPGGLMAISPELLQAATDPEGWQQHVSDLLDAIRPFYDLSSGANGRIPLDKPDYGDWDKLWKAYKAAKTAMRIDDCNAKMIANEDRYAEATRLNTLRLTGKECL